MSLNIKNSLLYSFFMHLLIIAVVIAISKKPVLPMKLADHWVINVAISGEEGEGAGVSALPVPHNDSRIDDRRDVIEKGETPERSRSEEPSVSASENPRHNSNMTFSPEQAQQLENTLKAAGESAGRQMQAMQQAFKVNIDNQMRLIQLKYFYRHAGNAIKALLYAAVPEDEMERLDGAAASVEITYGSEGKIEEVSVSPEADDRLAGIIRENIQWEKAPSPSRYTLPNRAVRYNIHIDVTNPKGKFMVKVELL